MKICQIVIGSLLLFNVAFSPGICQIYFWEDNAGVKHFSDQPPPDGLSFKEKSEVESSSKQEPVLPVPDALSEYGRFTVTRIYDGDSFKAVGHNITIKVRIIGIDAPETGKDGNLGQPLADVAKKFLKQMIMNKEVSLKGYGTGPYNRQLAEVYVGQKNVAIELLSAGLSETYPGRNPTGFDPAPYEKVQAAAQKSGIGIWALNQRYISPSKWRHMMKNGSTDIY